MSSLRFLPLAGACAAVALMFSPAAHAAEDASALTKAFLEKASMSDMFEIQSSQMALEKSENADIKQFAQQLIADHTKTSQQLKSIVAAENLDADLLADELDEKHEGILENLEDADTGEFDAAFIDAQVNAHSEAVTFFEDYRKSGDNQALQTFAIETLPSLREHQEHVAELKESMQPVGSVKQ
jgi:putative membrane protein